MANIGDDNSMHELDPDAIREAHGDVPPPEDQEPEDEEDEEQQDEEADAEEAEDEQEVVVVEGLPPPIPNPVAFSKKVHCSRPIQEAVGLLLSNVVVPKSGDRRAVGDYGHDQLGSTSYNQSFDQDQCKLLFRNLKDAAKNAPSPPLAEAVALLAQTAGHDPPEGCANVLTNGRAVPEPVITFIVAGGHLITGRKKSDKLVSFLFHNMDNGKRTKWSEMTGREQFEWVEAWEAHDCTHRRVEGTKGLRGTNLSTLTTTNAIEAALVVSPSSFKRRPMGADAAWKTAKNRMTSRYL